MTQRQGIPTCPGCGRVIRAATIAIDQATGSCVKHGAGQPIRWIDGGGGSRPHEWLYLPKPPPKGLT